jgi:hypothetical protein
MRVTRQEVYDIAIMIPWHGKYLMGSASYFEIGHFLRTDVVMNGEKMLFDRKRDS